ncbi:hypothetical protein FRC12_006375 [Ceratobasidium sp. 428]|nr:hypothetical protein FRC12_006375 [Ceratobasidium sp. 428]
MSWPAGKNEAGAREEYSKLATDMNELFRTLSGYFDTITPSAIPQDRIVTLAQGINEATKSLRSRNEGTRPGRQTNTSSVNAAQIIECYYRVCALLGRFVLNENPKIWRVPDEVMLDFRLDQLPHSQEAQYHFLESGHARRHGCTPGTRVDVLQRLQDWAYYDDNHKICWLNGMAGTGKTTIAYSLCNQLERTNKLAGSFFCSRYSLACRNVDRILLSISHQLSCLSRPFRCMVSDVLAQTPKIHELGASEQLEVLIAAPLRKVKYTFPGDMIIVIDALDECEDLDGIHRLVSALLAHEPSLPVKFLVTSRVSLDLINCMRSGQNQRLEWELPLDEVDRLIVKSDVKTYLRAELDHLGLSATNIDNLAQQSGTLFLYADVLASNVRNGDSLAGIEKLKKVLDTFTAAEEDMLYTTILQGILDDNTLPHARKGEIMLALRTVVSVDEPMDLSDVAEFLKINPNDLAQDKLHPLWSLLHVSDESGHLTIIHKSFLDYMLDPVRSGGFYHYAQQQSTRLALSCFDLIRRLNPPFNICDLESSYLRDQEVYGLDDKLSSVVSKELLHACRQWGTYLLSADFSKELLDSLYEFLSTRLLLWIEVLSLKRCVRDGAKQLRKACTWLEGIKGSDDAKLLVQDARSFVASFLCSPLQDTAPQIYTSMLPFWRKDRLISKHYMPRMTGLVKVEGSGTMRGRQLAKTSFTATGDVYCAAYSPSGAYIAACTGDSIQFLDAYTGELIGQPLLGHNGPVISAAYSPDGAYIVSGSKDQTIRIWDTHTRHLIGQPLVGHIDWVTSVAYSTDGARIVSGSRDKTIRIWDAHTRQPIGLPLNGHSGAVNCVVYSLDGLCVISGSDDFTIRIWDALSGQLIGQPLEGSASVKSVAHSPNGTHIASGYGNDTIRIWDAATGQPVGQPLRGHEDSVRSVTYSPDGAYILSGSADNTLRVWDTHTQRPVGPPFEGHTKAVSSVAYSSDGGSIISSALDGSVCIWENVCMEEHTGRPLDGHTDFVMSVCYSSDGAYILSASGDKTIRIWDATTMQPIGQPLEGHKFALWAAAYSPNRALIASCSYDEFIRIWDAHTQQPIGQPLQGHSDSVYSVTFSPDSTRIASGSADRSIRIWDAHTGQAIGQRLEGHFSWVTSVVYSPDGAHLASGSHDHTIRIWDAYTGQPVGQPFQVQSSVTSVAYSPDGAYIVSASWDHAVRIWAVRTGKLIHQPLEGHTDWVRSVAYSPSGAYIASCSNDTTIRIWDAYTGQLVGQPLVGHTAWVHSVAFSPDGACIVSGSRDRSIRIWNVPTRQPINDQPPEAREDSAPPSVSCPDSLMVVSSSDDCAIRANDTGPEELPHIETPSSHLVDNTLEAVLNPAVNSPKSQF